ncbi:protein-tyrosine phosphatase-like protein [Coniochaeta sp. 2T2.1]|nr:protein-tyrosine phosphatase-like protein [Coniochaeta sp. 2T2.1]
MTSTGRSSDEANGPLKPTFDNVLNFRDVGETVNTFLGRKFVRKGVLYRSARLDDATPSDRHRLRDDIGIRTVMDLRTKTEHLNAAKKWKADLAVAPVAHATSNDAVAEPLQIPGIEYREIKLTGRSFEIHLLRQLSWGSLLKFLVLFLFGFRMKAIAILGREVMLPRGLVGLGTDTLDHSGPEIREALGCFLEPGTLPILIHCTQGKDRTGIIVMLVLMILRVPPEGIDYDYQLSDKELQPEKASRLAEIREIGLSDEFGDTAKDMIERTIAHLDTRYGGLNSYLDGIDFGKEKRDKLRDTLAY